MNFVIENMKNLPKILDDIYLGIRKELLSDSKLRKGNGESVTNTNI